MSEIPYEMRRGFVYIDGKLEFNERRDMTNREWLIDSGRMTEEEFVKTVHGQYWPGRAYFYKGLDSTTTDDEVERVAELCRGQFNSETEICCGAIPGEIGTMWEPIKIIGYGTAGGD